MTDFIAIVGGSLERAPWGWGLFAVVVLAIIKGWPALSDAAVRAREAASSDRRGRYDKLEKRITQLETRLETTMRGLHEAEMKLVSALAAYRLVIGELQKIDPQNPVLKQAQALLNVSYPAPAAAYDGAREMVREAHAHQGDAE